MATYIVLNKNTIENLIIAETLEIAEELTKSVCMLHTNNQPVSIGWVYDSVKKTFALPIEETPID